MIHSLPPSPTKMQTCRSFKPWLCVHACAHTGYKHLTSWHDDSKSTHKHFVENETVPIPTQRLRVNQATTQWWPCGRKINPLIATISPEGLLGEWMHFKNHFLLEILSLVNCQWHFGKIPHPPTKEFRSTVVLLCCSHLQIGKIHVLRD